MRHGRDYVGYGGTGGGYDWDGYNGGYDDGGDDGDYGGDY